MRSSQYSTVTSCQSCRSSLAALFTTTSAQPIGWLKKAAHIKFPITHPSAYKFYTKMEFTSGNIGEMANYVDNGGMTHAEAATAYIANNRDQIDLFMK